MSVVVNISQNENKVKKIGLKFLETFANTQGLYYGILNNAYVIEGYKGENDIRNKLFVLYDKNIYGRGFSFLVKENYDIELVLNAPSLKIDIEIFYKFIKNFCLNFKIDKFYQEDLEYDIEKIENLKEESIKFNQSLIKIMLKPNLTIFGCIYPIVLEESFIKRIEKVKDEEAYDLFSKYLDTLQKKDCYFAKPLIYGKKDEDRYLAKYVLTKNVPSIFPVTTYLPFGYNQQLKKNIDSWTVSLVDLKNDKYEIIQDMLYDDFIKAINLSKYEKFDEKHVIITFDDNMLESIKKNAIKQAKNKIEEWLSNKQRLGKKPNTLKYTNNITDENKETYYIFKFKKNIIGKWIIGIASKKVAFSNMKEYNKNTEIKDAKELLEILTAKVLNEGK